MSSIAIARNESNLRLHSLKLLETLALLLIIAFIMLPIFWLGDYCHQAASKSLYDRYHFPADA